MDDNSKQGVRGEIGFQLSEATKVTIQPTESDINQDRVLSIVSAYAGLSGGISTYCTDNYNFRENIKYEHEPLGAMHEDNACSHQIESVHGHLTTGLQTATYEHLHQEITEKTVIRSCENSSQETTSTKEIKSDRDGCVRNTDLTRYWVTCPGGILKEVKAEHKPDVSAILPDEDRGENGDEKERVQNGGKHSTSQEIQISLKPPSNTLRRCKVVKPFNKTIVDSSHLKMIERIYSKVKHFTCDTCRRLFVTSSELKMHESIHTGVKRFTCETCGKSFVSPSQRLMHDRTHTGVKPFNCVTCGKSFARTNNLKAHERTHTGLKPFNCVTCGKHLHVPTISKCTKEHTQV